VYVPFGLTTSYVDLTELAGKFVRITVTAEDMFYVFVASTSDDMVGLTSADFKFDMTAGVPDIIGFGTSVREVVPQSHPILAIRSATGVAGEVRIRRA
jgi:hypothetical protein